MPTKIEKDAITGQETTGHEWDGIKELNTPLPRWWLHTFYACILFSLVYVVLYPAIPSFSGYTEGTLGYNSRQDLEQQMIRARARQGENRQRIAEAELQEIRSDADLLNFALAGGDAAFADNCAPCHGQGGAGRPGYPVLADDVWIWGGSLEEIHITLLHGIELNIDAEGALDYDADFRQLFDWCLASVHSHFNLAREAQTERIVRAMRDPSVDMIGIEQSGVEQTPGHPRGKPV